MSDHLPPKKIDIRDPFEVQEAILSQSEKSRLAKGPLARQLFEGAPDRLEVREFSLRSLSLRVRTINNACDSGASLPDGTPLTEVSLYGGGRDRQYLVGPYVAVKRLMEGLIPSRTPQRVFSEKAHKDCVELNSAEEALVLLTHGLESESLNERLYLPCLIKSRAAPERIDRSVELGKQDIGYLRDALARLAELKGELPKMPEPAEPPVHWWQEMPPLPDLSEYERQTDELLTKARAVLHDLEEKVFTSPPDGKARRRPRSVG